MDLGQVFTNESVARLMVSLFTIDKSAKILDPCFGKGAFIDACVEKGFENIDGFEIDVDLFNLVSTKHSKLSLKNIDFFKVDNKIKYDAIIMNPPYIRQEKIDDLKSYGITKQMIRKDPIFGNLPNTANMYMYFIVKALNLLNIGGEMLVIFPSSWLNARSGKDFEKIMRSLGVIEKQIHISGEVFETNALVEVVILKLIRGVKASSETIEYAKLENGKVITVSASDNLENIVLRTPFCEYGSVRRGLTTFYNSMFINPDITEDEFFLHPIISGPKSVKGYDTQGASLDKLLLVQGNVISNDVSLYLEEWKKKIKKEKKPKTLFEKIQSDPNWYKITPIESKGILFSYFVRNDMKFIMNESGVLARDNFYIIRPTINIYLLFALLNSLYTYYQLEYNGKRYGAGLLKVQKYDVENLSFPDINSFTENDSKSLVDLAQTMVRTNESKVWEITKVISAYTAWDFQKITDSYESIKKSRLEVK